MTLKKILNTFKEIQGHESQPVWLTWLNLILCTKGRSSIPGCGLHPVQGHAGGS